MSNLLVTMLQSINIDAYITWIGTRDKPFDYKELPSPQVDNHMICAVFINDEVYFLDPTAKYLEFGLPSPFIQNKEALITKKDNFLIKRIPTVAIEKNQINHTYHLSLEENNTIKGTFKGTYSGLKRLNLLHHYYNSDKNTLGYINRIFNIKPYVKLNAPEVTGIDRTDTITIISSDFESKENIRSFKNKLILKTNFETTLEDVKKITQKECYGHKIEFKKRISKTISLKIPHTYSVEHLPKNIHLDGEKFSLETSYSFEKETLLIKQIIKINTLDIKENDFADWNLFTSEFIAADNQSIILTKKI